MPSEHCLTMLSTTYAGYAILLLVSSCKAYPGGAPYCTAVPVHGQNTGCVAATVENTGDNKWKVGFGKK